MKKIIVVFLMTLSLSAVSQTRYVYEIDTVFKTESGFSVSNPVVVVGVQHISGTDLAFDFETHLDTNAVKNRQAPFYLLSHVDSVAFKAYQFTPLTPYQGANYCLPTGDFTNSYINILSLKLGVSEDKIKFYTFP
jgi:hypothetical protein